MPRLAGLPPPRQDIARDGRVLLPELFAGHSSNTVLAVLTGTRLPPEQYPVARELARRIKGFQRAGNASGGALDATPWLRFLAPGGFGLRDYKNGNDALIYFMSVRMSSLPACLRPFLRHSTGTRHVNLVIDRTQTVLFVSSAATNKRAQGVIR